MVLSGAQEPCQPSSFTFFCVRVALANGGATPAGSLAWFFDLQQAAGVALRCVRRCTCLSQWALGLHRDALRHATELVLILLSEFLAALSAATHPEILAQVRQLKGKEKL